MAIKTSDFAEGSMLKITVIRSTIGQNKQNVARIQSLFGELKAKPGRSVIRPNHPSVIGVLNKIDHMIKVEEVTPPTAEPAKETE